MSNPKNTTTKTDLINCYLTIFRLKELLFENNLSSLDSIKNKDILWDVVATQDSWITHLIASIYRLFDKKKSKMKTFYHVDCYDKKELDIIKATEQFKRLEMFRHSRIAHYFEHPQKKAMTDDLLFIFSKIESLILKVKFPFLTVKKEKIKKSSKEFIDFILSYKNIGKERHKNDIF